MKALEFIIGERLKSLCSGAAAFVPRDAFYEMERFCNDDSLHSKLGIIYGLRNTGKTIIMQQLAGRAEYLSQSAYIVLSYRQCDVQELEPAIQQLLDAGYKYIYIDEVTYAGDFIDYSMGLANRFPGAKIVLSGTDSLSFKIASQDALFHRTVYAKTTWMSYKEYKRILGADVISYMHNGGVFWGSPSEIDLSEYLQTSIVNNIFNSMHNIDRTHIGKESLQSLTKDALYNIVYAIGQSLTLDLLKTKLEILKGTPFAHGLSKALKACQIRLTPAAYYGLERDSYPYSVTSSVFDARQVEIIIEYLQKLDFLVDIPVYTGRKPHSRTLIFTQPGIAREFVRNVVFGIMQSTVLTDTDKLLVLKELDANTDGDVLESIVTLNLLEKFKTNKDRVEISKVREYTGEYEIDTVMNIVGGSLCLFEVKRTDKIKHDSAKHLINPRVIADIEGIFGKKVTYRVVLYRGETCTREITGVPVIYGNIEEFLLYPQKIINIVNFE